MCVVQWWIPCPDVPTPPSYGTDTTGSVSGPSCTFTIQASELGAGTHRLSVNMYPQFDGSGVAYGNISTVSPDVTFCYPVPEIVNCPSGAKVSGDHIMSGSTATCKCRQKTEGFPAGTVVLSQGGSTLGSGTVASGTVINPGNNNNDQTLTCRSESSLGQAGPSVSKIVKFAYGPRSATLTFSPTSPSSLCQGPSLSVVSTCTVDPRTVNPQPLYKISVNGAPVGTPVQQTLQLQGGAHNISCLIENALFPADLFTDVTETFIVREPPKTAPKLVINGKTFTGVSADNTIVLVAGIEHSVECHVDGGFPEISASDISLQCGGWNVTDGKFVPSVLSVCLNETSCSCRAEHPSGCYDLATEVSFPLIVGGTNGGKLEQENGVHVTTAVAVGAVVAAFVLGFITAVAVYCLLSRKGLLLKNCKFSKCGNSKDEQEPNSDGLPNELSELYLNDTAYPNQQDDTRRVTGNPTEASSSAGRQEESLYVDVDSDHISSQDIHTPVLIGKTMAEIITPDATLTDGDGRHYNNVLVTSPVSRAGPGGQGHSHNPGTYDVIADPAREAFAHPYMRFQPGAEYSDADEMDGPSSSLQNDSTGKGTYVDKGKNKKARASPYANVNDDNKEKPRTSPYANVNNDNVSGSVWFQKKKR